MRKYFTFTLLSICFLSLTSCLDILEKINFNQDGSGEYTLLLSFNEAFKKTLEESKKAGDTIEDDEQFTAEAENKAHMATMYQVVEQLKEIEGISDVELLEENFEFGYQYKFKDLQALNNAFELTSKEYQTKTPENYYLDDKKKRVYQATMNYIEKNKNTIIRHQNAELAKVFDLNKKKGSNTGMAGGLDIAYLFQDMNFKTTYSFEKNVKKVNNEAAVIDGKTVTVNCMPFAYTSPDLKTLKLNEAACEQSIQIELK